MMRVTVEIWPGGDASAKKQIATIDIANVTMLSEVSDYQVAADFDGARQSAAVFGHRRSDGWGPLVLRTLRALGVKAERT